MNLAELKNVWKIYQILKLKSILNYFLFFTFSHRYTKFQCFLTIELTNQKLDIWMLLAYKASGFQGEENFIGRKSECDWEEKILAVNDQPER